MNNVRKAITRIEEHRGVIEAQADRLATLSLGIQNLGPAQNLTNASELLDAVVLAQLKGAVQALGALARVEGDFRSLRREQNKAATGAQSAPQTINAEFTANDPEEEENA